MYCRVYDSRMAAFGVGVHSKSDKLLHSTISHFPTTHHHCSQKIPNIIFIKNQCETIYNVYFYIR